MLHLAFTERALLADEMGLGKTIQAIAACALLHRLGKAARVLVVTPASLKTEWEEQIQRFTALPYQLVFGGRAARLAAYGKAPFFTIVNYEQMLADALRSTRGNKPDVVVLDEAQRIKNWSTKTTQAIKRLRSRYLARVFFSKKRVNLWRQGKRKNPKIMYPPEKAAENG